MLDNFETFKESIRVPNSWSTWYALPDPGSFSCVQCVGHEKHKRKEFTVGYVNARRNVRLRAETGSIGNWEQKARRATRR